MARSTIDRLIVHSPDEQPAHHWRYDRTTRRFALVPGRRPAGYVVASKDSRAFDDRRSRRLAFYGAAPWSTDGNKSPTVTPRATAMSRNVHPGTEPMAALFSIADNRALDTFARRAQWRSARGTRARPGPGCRRRRDGPQGAASTISSPLAQLLA